MQKLYSDTKALYHLENRMSASGKTDLGPLPSGAKALIATLVVVWILILAYVISEQVRKRAKRQ